MTKTLDHLRVHETARVAALSGDAMLRERLVELGFTRGARVEVRGRAPLGDPIHVLVRGGQIAVRRDEAACVVVADAASDVRS